jgi:hypothetical protein
VKVCSQQDNVISPKDLHMQDRSSFNERLQVRSYLAKHTHHAGSVFLVVVIIRVTDARNSGADFAILF